MKDRILKSNVASQRQPRRVWLHIGMPKTGSTAIQFALYKNRAELRSSGYFYPDFGDEQHVALARMLARKAGSDIDFPREGTCPQDAKFIDFWRSKAPDCHNAILSTEYLFQRSGGIPGIKQLSTDSSLEMIRRNVEVTKDYLQDLDVNIVLWIRRQDNWLMSIYNQAVKSTLYRDNFDVFVANTIGTRLFEIVSIWVDLFGRDKVQCFSYDSLIAQRGNIVSKFASVVGLKPNFPLTNPDNDRKNVNASLSREALEIKLIINQHVASLPPTARRPELVSFILKKTDRLSKESKAWPHALISPDERLELLSPFMEGNSKLVSELGYTELSDLSDVSDLIKLKESGTWSTWPGFDNGDITSKLLSIAFQDVDTERSLVVATERAKRNFKAYQIAEKARAAAIGALGRVEQERDLLTRQSKDYFKAYQDTEQARVAALEALQRVRNERDAVASQAQGYLKAYEESEYNRKRALSYRLYRLVTF